MQVYETNRYWRKHKQVSLACLALELQDEEYLRVMAQEFLNSGARYEDHIY